MENRSSGGEHNRETKSWVQIANIKMSCHNNNNQLNEYSTNKHPYSTYSFFTIYILSDCTVEFFKCSKKCIQKDNKYIHRTTVTT